MARKFLLVCAGMLMLALSYLAPPTALGQTFITQWGSCGDGIGQFKGARSIVLDAQGDVIVAEDERIQKFTQSGGYLSQLGSAGIGAGEFALTRDMEVDDQGHIFWLGHGGLELFSVRIQKLALDGAYLTQWGPIFCYEYDFSSSIENMAIDRYGSIHVSAGVWGILRYSNDGMLLSPCNGVVAGPMTFDSDNNLFLATITARGYHRIQKYGPAGELLAEWGSYGTGPGQFNTIYSLAVDKSGNVYACDIGNNRIQKFAGDGTYLTQWGQPGTGPGEFNRPTDIIASSDGKLFVVDSGNCRVQVFGDLSTPTQRTTWGRLKAVYR